MAALLQPLQNLMDTAEGYGVSVPVFLVVYLGSFPFWYLGMWWVISGWHRRDHARLRLGVVVNRLATVAPYLYLWIAGGKDLPPLWWLVTLVIPLAGTTFFIRKMRDEEWMNRWWNRYRSVLPARFTADDGAGPPVEETVGARGSEVT